MSNEILQQFGGSAGVLTHMLDIPTDRVLLSRLSEQDYRAASFLDQRIITPELQHQAVPWSAVDNVQMPKTLPSAYIFHIGHVGSTLISRLLGEHKDVLAVREPQILRDLAEITLIKDQPQSPWPPQRYTERAALVKSWLSRSFHEGQRAMVKVSSFANELADELIGPDNKSLFLYVSLSKYLETILAGDGSRQEAKMLAEARLSRLNNRLGAPLENLWELSHVQQIALGWLCEMSTLMQTAAQKNAALIYWHNFETFLKDPQSELLKIAAHFGLTFAPEDAQNLISGPIMNSYSKAPEHDYSPDLRRQLLQQARANFGAEIKSTIGWVEGLAKTHPLIDTIVQFADKE